METSIKPGDCFVAVKTGNPYVVYALEEGKASVYFPFFGIRWTAWTLPIASVIEDRALSEKITLDEDGKIDGIEIIEKLSKYDNR